jgi:hypothetical protein
VAWYRLYFFNSKDRISRALDIECDDDGAAVSELRRHKTSFPVEIWQEARLVARIEGEPTDA